MKKILFVHNNFPAQFLHVAQALASEPGMKLAAIGTQTARRLPGVAADEIFGQRPGRCGHPSVCASIRSRMPPRRGGAVCRVLIIVVRLRSGYCLGAPRLGRGATATLDLSEGAAWSAYCEFFYRAEGQDKGFDPEFPQTGVDGDVGLQLKNAATLLALVDCDSAISPTQWQRSTFPEEFQPKIKVIHEGVDVDKAKPSPHAKLRLPSGRFLTKADDVVTFVARNFEPVRGFHIFTRALPRILAAHPRAQIVFVGGEGNPYGALPPHGQSHGRHSSSAKSPIGSTRRGSISPAT